MAVNQQLEVEVVLAGQVIAQLACVCAAAHIRSGRLVSLLTRHVSDEVGIHLYCGSCTSQPASVRAFTDLAVKRLAGGADCVLSSKKLPTAEAKGCE